MITFVALCLQRHQKPFPLIHFAFRSFSCDYQAYTWDQLANRSPKYHGVFQLWRGITGTPRPPPSFFPLFHWRTVITDSNWQYGPDIDDNTSLYSSIPPSVVTAPTISGDIASQLGDLHLGETTSGHAAVGQGYIDDFDEEIERNSFGEGVEHACRWV